MTEGNSQKQHGNGMRRFAKLCMHIPALYARVLPPHAMKYGTRQPATDKKPCFHLF